MKRKLNLQFFAVFMMLAVLFGGCNVKKMVKNYDQVKYTVTPEILQADGGKINFTIKGTYPPNYFKKQAIVEMKPFLTFGDQKLDLTPIVNIGEKVHGKLSKDKAGTVKYNSAGLPASHSTVAKKEALENVISYKKGGSFTMQTVVDYVPAMNISELYMGATVSGKNKVVHQDVEVVAVNIKQQIPLPERKIADGVIHTGTRIENVDNLTDFRWKTNDDGMPANMNEWSADAKKAIEKNRMLYSNDITNRMALGDLLVAESGYEKQSVISKSAKIYFAKNLYALNWNLTQNKKNQTPKQIDELKSFLSQGWQIKEVVIDGWASPEGEETFNDGLSENRAKTAQKYIVGEFKTLAKSKDSKMTIKDPEKEIEYKITSHGPDWSGFLVEVDNSTLADKKSINNVIKSAPQDKREVEIRNMILIYSEMEESILSPLRRAEILINFFEPKKSDAEIARLSSTNPEELDAKELLYAATLTMNLKTQLNIYKSITRIYPSDWRGFNNAAFAEMKLGNVKEASSLMEKAKSIEPNNGIVLNNLGVVSSLQKDYPKAETYFQKSQSMGVSQNYNLGVLMIPKGDYQKSLDLMKGKTCDYNVGLAQLLSGNAQGASKNLECAPKTDATYYLLAVVGARTNNTVMLYNNLQKAVEGNSAYKKTAKDDREFLKFYEEEAFKKIVD